MDDQNKQDRPNGEAEPSLEENVQTRLEVSSDDLASSSEENWVATVKEEQLQNNRQDTNEESEAETFEMTEFRRGDGVQQAPENENEKHQENEKACSEMYPENSEDNGKGLTWGQNGQLHNNGPYDTDNQLSEFKCDPSSYRTTGSNALDKKVKNKCGNKQEPFCETSSEDDFSMKTQSTDPLWYKIPGKNSFVTQPSKKRVERAMERLRSVERCQENNQYAEALSLCEIALKSLCLSDDINLHMMFCSNIMQLHYMMGNIDEAINTYYDRCLAVLENSSDGIDPKVIQTIMDLHTLCFKKFTPTKEEQ